MLKLVRNFRPKLENKTQGTTIDYGATIDNGVLTWYQNMKS